MLCWKEWKAWFLQMYCGLGSGHCSVFVTNVPDICICIGSILTTTYVFYDKKEGLFYCVELNSMGGII